MRLGMSNPEAGWRPATVREGAVLGLVDEHRLLVIKADVPELQHFVPIEQLSAVRRPPRTVTIGAAIGGDARFLAAHLRASVELEFAGPVGEIRDPLSIRRPGGIQFVNTGMIGGQRSNAAVLGRYRENIAAGLNQRTRRRRRDPVAPNALRNPLEFRAVLDVFRAHHSRETARLTTG